MTEWQVGVHTVLFEQPGAARQLKSCLKEALMEGERVGQALLESVFQEYKSGRGNPLHIPQAGGIGEEFKKNCNPPLKA